MLEYMISILDEAPDNAESGKVWIDSRSGQAYIYIAGQWRPFAGGNPVTEGGNTEYKTSIFIAGNNVSRYLKKASLRITDNLTDRVDSASFTLEDYDGGHKPESGSEVEIFYTDLTSLPEKIFGGEIVEVPESQVGRGDDFFYSYELSATDYSRRLQRKLVLENYTNKTCREIISDIIANYAPDYTINNVQEGLTIGYIAFNYKNVMECIRELANLTGYDWYVDYYKDIHFFSKKTNPAPYQLVDDKSVSGQYSNLKITIDKSQLRNRVIVRGGYYLSELYTQYITADGQQTDFVLSYEPYSPISVYVDGEQKTLGIDNINNSGYDFVVNQTEKTIKNLDLAKLSAGQVFKATYRRKIPILVAADDIESQEAVSSIEGGDGIYEYLITDTSIETLQLALDRAKAELRQYSNALVEGSFETTQSGYKSGQILTINLTRRNISNEYIIQRVERTAIGLGNYVYTVTFATMLKGLADFLGQLYDKTKETVTREDEVLYDYFQRRETIIPSDIETFVEWEVKLWGSVANRQGKWNGVDHKWS